KSAAIGQFLAAFVHAGKWSNAHEKEWGQRYYSDFQRIDAEGATAILAAQSPLVFQTSREAIPHHQKLIDILHAAGSLKERFDAAGSFVGTFDDIVAAQR
ncbi:MAG TPA: ABC transporter substrate-binding protein, partial [Variovorax sp.]|nr:ABC transporter substrate-binding protein [Variovorax sp.]